MTKNVSRAFQVYEDMFTFRQKDESLEDNYGSFKNMMNKLNQYHPV